MSTSASSQLMALRASDAVQEAKQDAAVTVRENGR